MMNMKQDGFTLIELMVVVAIVGILAMIAYPSYELSVMKSRRSEAREALLMVAGLEERYMTANNRYGTGSVIGLGGDTKITDHEAYKIEITLNNSGSGYVATATPLGRQNTLDQACGTLSYDNIGNKEVTGNSSKPLSECW